jgi:hypothetical protein
MTRTNHENTAEVGDLVKVYDFKPMSDRPSMYVVGRVVSKGFVDVMFDENGVPYGGGFSGYTIKVYHDTMFDNGERDEIVTPFEAGFMDWDGRISKYLK